MGGLTGGAATASHCGDVLLQASALSLLRSARGLGRLMRAGLVLLLLVTACAPVTPLRAADFPDEPPACIGDDDCVLSSFSGNCCPSCPGPLRVWARAALREQQMRCTEVECARREGIGEPSRCAPLSRRPLRGARCVNARCIEAR